MAQNNEGSWGLLTHGVGTGLGLDSKAQAQMSVVQKRRALPIINSITALT